MRSIGHGLPLRALQSLCGSQGRMPAIRPATGPAFTSCCQCVNNAALGHLLPGREPGEGFEWTMDCDGCRCNEVAPATTLMRNSIVPYSRTGVNAVAPAQVSIRSCGDRKVHSGGRFERSLNDLRACLERWPAMMGVQAMRDEHLWEHDSMGGRRLSCLRWATRCRRWSFARRFSPRWRGTRWPDSRLAGNWAGKCEFLVQRYLEVDGEFCAAWAVFWRPAAANCRGGSQSSRVARRARE